MSEDWAQYQEDAATFFRSLGFNVEVNRLVEGVRSKHKIDVYVTFEKWGMRHTWIVECKKHERAITKADVETLKSIASEVGAGLAFLLSESGFQSGAFDAARKTNVILSSLQESLIKSRDDVMREAISTLEVRALELQNKLFRDFMQDVETGPDYGHYRVRDGVDGAKYLSMVGSLALLNMALDGVRLGRFPVTLPGDLDKTPNSYSRCTNLEEFVAKAAGVLERVKTWAAQQNPQ